MKALTLIQPWASLIAAGVKTDETRGHRTSHRGEIAIHAGLKASPDIAPEPLTSLVFGLDWEGHLPRGAVVAVADVVACITTAEASRTSTRSNLRCGNFSAGRHAWRLLNIRPLWTPVPARGMQGLWAWTPPEDTAFRLKPAVDHADVCRRLGLD